MLMSNSIDVLDQGEAVSDSTVIRSSRRRPRPGPRGVVRPSKLRHVALLIETSGSYGRGLLRGIAKYNRDHDADYPLVAREFKNSIAFTRKPSAVIGTSPGKIGTAIGQQHLRSILSFCNSPQMNSIEAYIQFEPGLITDDGEVTNGTTADFFRTYMKEFHGFIARVYTVLPRNP